MFFSLLYLFYVIILTNSGCKNRDFFQNNQEENTLQSVFTRRTPPRMTGSNLLERLKLKYIYK